MLLKLRIKLDIAQSCRTVPVKPRTQLLRIWRLQPIAGKSRPARSAVPTGSPNTINCCGSRKVLESPHAMQGGRPSKNESSICSVNLLGQIEKKFLEKRLTH